MSKADRYCLFMALPALLTTILVVLEELYRYWHFHESYLPQDLKWFLICVLFLGYEVAKILSRYELIRLGAQVKGIKARRSLPVLPVFEDTWPPTPKPHDGETPKQ